ncbi:MAG: leucyl aminopeptidase family protein [Bdellovibrionota bacterium]
MSVEILPPSFLSELLGAKKSTKSVSGPHLRVLISKDDAQFAARVKKIVGSAHGEWAASTATGAENFLKLADFDLVTIKLPASLRKVGGGFAYLNGSAYGHGRDMLGAAIRKYLRKDHAALEIHFENLPEEALLGALVGLEMSHYSFRPRSFPYPVNTTLLSGGRVLPASIVERGARLGRAVNFSRHLVNLPPNELNPPNYADAVKKLFAKSKTMSVEVWDETRLEKENLQLLLAVGSGSATPPRLVRLRYRPSGTKGKSGAPRIVFVGKGITFDSGGLDIKPASGMRLMKKDMGGSASVLGLAYWLEDSGVKDNVDFYLAMAENSMGDRAFRPGDVYKTRKGLTIEIDNTDAEGRLVLADALTVALEDAEPEYLIDLATLTGAGKVALGTELASLFATDDTFLKELLKSAQETEDLSWPMPLWEKYDSMYKSSFADWANSSAGGFGGAITAALFLKKFVDPSPVKWAHYDIYGWKDSAEGPFSDKGGNAQCVQALVNWLEKA